MKNQPLFSGLTDLKMIPPIDDKWAGFGPHNYGAWGWVYVREVGVDFFEDPILILDAEWHPVTKKLTGIGLSKNGTELLYWPNPGPELAVVLAGKRFIGHNLISDLDVLRFNGIPVTNDQIYWDTRLGSATEDPTKDTHALKALCKAELGMEWPELDELCTRSVVTVNKKGKEIVKRVKFAFEDLSITDQAKYNGMDVLGAHRLAQKQMAASRGTQRKLFVNVELPIASLVGEMKAKGLKVDRDGLQRKAITQRDTVYGLRDSLVKETNQPDFNLNSPPQVLKFLKSRGHKITSTGEEVIRPLGDSDPWIHQLLAYRGAFKLLTTYIEPLLEHSAADGRIHTNFNQVAMMANGKERPIITGRFSSSDPINLQNQPPEVREFFIPEDGHVFVCADYSQIDLRSLAHLSMEPVYAEAFRKGEKVHQAIANQFKVEYKLGKIISLALAYNGGPGRLKAEADSWGYKLDYWECKRLADRFVNELATLTAWKEAEYAKAKKLGGVFTLFGRWIPLPYPTETTDPEAYCFKHWKNCVIAFQGQGGTADIVKGGMLRLRQKSWIPNAQVHDEILYEVPAGDVDTVRELVKHELEHVTTLRVPLVAEVGVGENWLKAKP